MHIADWNHLNQSDLKLTPYVHLRSLIDYSKVENRKPIQHENNFNLFPHICIRDIAFKCLAKLPFPLYIVVYKVNMESYGSNRNIQSNSSKFGAQGSLRNTMQFKEISSQPLLRSNRRSEIIKKIYDLLEHVCLGEPMDLYVFYIGLIFINT